ncbi:hypothetical protein PUN28_012571 [Cardiocondyla obscurior]|uniref:Uncharacterized protein n=1 Tax=Cardiocondyla obscurior TaxID=286306 RepID=A0AAW2FG08_9HYME
MHFENFEIKGTQESSGKREEKKKEDKIHGGNAAKYERDARAGIARGCGRTHLTDSHVNALRTRRRGRLFLICTPGMDALIEVGWKIFFSPVVSSREMPGRTRYANHLLKQIRGKLNFSSRRPLFNDDNRKDEDCANSTFAFYNLRKSAIARKIFFYLLFSFFSPSLYRN